MKRSFLYLATVCALALSACSTESNIREENPELNVIGFSNFVSKPTRAEVAGLDQDNLKHFMVYGYYTLNGKPETGYQVFNNTAVDYNEATSNWGYANERYWIPGASYYFYAYSCGTENTDLADFLEMDMNETTAEGRVLKINGYVCDEDHQQDLIFAVKKNIEGQEGGKNNKVSLKFKHLLTKVNAEFTSAFPEEYTIVVSDVRIEKVLNTGWYDPNQPNNWTKAEGEGKVYLLTEADGTISTTKGEEGAKTFSAHVLPWEYETKVELNFDVTLKIGEEEILSRHMSGIWTPTWTMGYKYTYNIEINGSNTGLEAIAFEIAEDETGKPVADWGNGTDNAEIEIKVVEE